MKLVAGLGNPGKEYAESRHNIGFRCVNLLARRHGISVSQKHGRARVGYGTIAGQEVILAKPQTFMNKSGDSVSMLANRFKIPAEDIIVVCDDLDLPLGRVRIRPRGGSGGHKGLESIIGALGTQDFARVRIGIGRPEEERREVVDYVLGDFLPDEKPVIEEALATAANAVDSILANGIDAAMNNYNPARAPAASNNAPAAGAATDSAADHPD